MTTLSDLKEVKEALNAGLVSQADYDDVKRNYLRAKLKAIELQTKELRAKEEALEARKEFQKRKADAELRGFALEAIVQHGSSIMSEEQRVDLVRDYVKMAGLDRGAEMAGPSSKRQRIKAEPRDAMRRHRRQRRQPPLQLRQIKRRGHPLLAPVPAVVVS